MDGLVQDCSNSIDNTLELLQSCTKALNYHLKFHANIILWNCFELFEQQCLARKTDLTSFMST